MEQNARDSRIAQLYEGTTGVQSLDLLGRKIILSKGKPLMAFSGEVLGYCKKTLIDKRSSSSNKKEAATLAWYTLKYLALSAQTVVASRTSKENVSVAAVDYLHYSGFIIMAFHWLKMMDVAAAALKKDPYTDAEFYSSKIKTGQFFFEKLLPRADGYASVIRGGAKTTMNLTLGELLAGRK